MRHILRIAIASLLIASASAATAQVRGGANSQPAGPKTAPYQGTTQRAHTIPYSYQEYGLDAACSNRPFAAGCDKRGFW